MYVDSFSPKLTTESELFSFDFSQVLASGESISTASCSIVVVTGTDLTPNTLLISTAVISSPQAAQRVAAGVANVTYRLIMTITTSAGNTYTGLGDFTVLDPTSTT